MRSSRVALTKSSGRGAKSPMRGGGIEVGRPDSRAAERERRGAQPRVGRAIERADDRAETEARVGDAIARPTSGTRVERVERAAEVRDGLA